MRAFLIKYCFGRYWYIFPGQKHYNNCNRGPFWFFNGFLLIGIIWWLLGRPDAVLIAAIPWAVLVLYFGFPIGGLGYFSKFPVKWSELDAEQKWYYGSGVMSGNLRTRPEFNSQQMSQWININKYFRDKYNLK